MIKFLSFQLLFVAIWKDILYYVTKMWRYCSPISLSESLNLFYQKDMNVAEFILNKSRRESKIVIILELRSLIWRIPEYANATVYVFTSINLAFRW